MSDFTIRVNHNLIIGGTSQGTPHHGGLILQEQPDNVRKTHVKVATGTSTHADLGLPAWRASPLDAYQSWGGCPTRNATNLGRNLPTPASIPSVRKWEHAFPHPGVILELLNDPRLTPPPPNPRTPVVTPDAFQRLTNQVQAIAGMLQAIMPYIPQLAQQPSSRPPATPLLQTRTTLPLNEPSSMTPSADNPPHFSLESDQAPLGDVTKQPKPVPSTSACNFLDLDTLSSNSIGSLREQLCLVNQRIDEV
ncbi:hypothetical protein BHM03_00060936 [Ensete ventricosum]|nr:hypothetical protein BHM03_00060936 [Ensete ventricosum]